MFGSLDGLDLLNEEGSDDSALDASTAQHSSVGTRNVLVLLCESFVVVGSELGDAVKSLAAFAAIQWRTGSFSSFAGVLDNNSGSGSSDFSDFVGLGVVAKSASVGNSLHHLW